MKRIQKAQATTENFTIVPNEFIRDTRISGLARAVLIYMMSYPSGYNVWVNSIKDHFGFGRRVWERVSEELIEVGAIVRHPAQLGQEAFNEFNWPDYEGTPKDLGEGTVQNVQEGTVQNVHPYKYCNKTKNNTTSKDDKIESMFSEFWKAYPRKVGKGSARRSFKTALTKTTFSEIMEGVKGYVSDTKDKEVRYIAHASTWLNGERWADERISSKQSEKETWDYL